MPGFTAHVGLLDIGRPVAGETVVVAAASGAVGSVLGRIAKIQGGNVVGSAGGEDSCRYVIDKLSFDSCVARRADDLSVQLAKAFPKGVDSDFANGGGAVFDAVLLLLTTKVRVPRVRAGGRAVAGGRCRQGSCRKPSRPSSIFCKPRISASWPSSLRTSETRRTAPPTHQGDIK